MAEPYVGEIRMFAGTFVPQDWVLCDGSLLSISDYEALFALIGTTYGGDGVTQFKLPDLRGRAPIHRSATYPLGAQGGTETVTLASTQMPAHTHLAKVKTANGSSSGPGAHYWAGNSDFTCYMAADPHVPFNAAAITPAGGSQPHENMMPFTTVSFIMATNGIYPQSN